MTKQQLVRRTAEATGLTQGEVKKALDGLAEVVIASVAEGESIELPGFLKIERVLRKARSGKVPGTDRVYEIEEKWVPRIRPGKQFKERVAEASPSA